MTNGDPWSLKIEMKGRIQVENDFLTIIPQDLTMEYRDPSPARTEPTALVESIDFTLASPIRDTWEIVRRSQPAALSVEAGRLEAGRPVAVTVDQSFKMNVHGLSTLAPYLLILNVIGPEGESWHAFSDKNLFHDGAGDEEAKASVRPLRE